MQQRKIRICLDERCRRYRINAEADALIGVQPHTAAQSVTGKRAIPLVEIDRTPDKPTIDTQCSEQDETGELKASTSFVDGVRKFMNVRELDIDLIDHINPFDAAYAILATIGRKNWLFAGSKTGGERAAQLYTVIETAKLNGLEPQAYIADVIEKIAQGWPASRWDELMPWTWRPSDLPIAEAA